PRDPHADHRWWRGCPAAGRTRVRRRTPSRRVRRPQPRAGYCESSAVSSYFAPWIGGKHIEQILHLVYLIELVGGDIRRKAEDVRVLRCTRTREQLFDHHERTFVVLDHEREEQP